MKNKIEIINEDSAILYCPSPLFRPDEEVKVTIDKKIVSSIEKLEGTWEECLNPYFNPDNGEQKQFTIGAIVHQQFVDLNRVILGMEEIPTNNENVPKSISMQEYVTYLNSSHLVYKENTDGSVMPLTHVIAKASWDEGVIYINGNGADNREINLLKVKIDNLPPNVCLHFIEEIEEEKVVYKRKHA